MNISNLGSDKLKGTNLVHSPDEYITHGMMVLLATAKRSHEDNLSSEIFEGESIIERIGELRRMFPEDLAVGIIAHRSVELKPALRESLAVQDAETYSSEKDFRISSRLVLGTEAKYQAW